MNKDAQGEKGMFTRCDAMFTGLKTPLVIQKPAGQEVHMSKGLVCVRSSTPLAQTVNMQHRFSTFIIDLGRGIFSRISIFGVVFANLILLKLPKSADGILSSIC